MCVEDNLEKRQKMLKSTFNINLSYFAGGVTSSSNVFYDLQTWIIPELRSFIPMLGEVYHQDW